ncbi:hypothetical protein EB093_09170 [bacterium]|nr:hypothetical protein [bacterium]
MTDADFCAQRAIAQQYNVPLTRFTPPNPYENGQYTKTQLDMRRKAEILKYAANKSSTQTNNLTKKQSYALLSRGSLSKSSQSTLLSAANSCAADRSIPRPSSASNVPGPVVYLYEDPAVPLYHYSDFNTRTYPDYNPGNGEAPWKVITYTDVSLNPQSTGNLFYLILSNYIDQPIHVYDVNIPVGVSISGVRKTGVAPDNIKVDIKSMTMTVYYNTSVASTLRNPTNTGANSTGLNLVFDVSNTSPGAFTATQYLGNLGFQEIQLFTSPTYVYSFLAAFSISVSSPSMSASSSNQTIQEIIQDYFGSGGLSIQVIANMSPGTNSSTNCNILNISGDAPNAFDTVNTGASLSEHVG